MYRIACVLALAAALAAGGAARASDPTGGYLIVDKVILEPSSDPTTIQIWGSFALTKEAGGRAYADPVRGYLYYKIVTGKEEATVEAGEKETKWTPKMKVKAGEKYTWRVRATDGDWKGPVVTSGFVVKG